MNNKKSIFLILILTVLIFLFSALSYYASSRSSKSLNQTQKVGLYDFPLIKSDSDARGGDISISQNENGRPSLLGRSRRATNNEKSRWAAGVG